MKLHKSKYQVTLTKKGKDLLLWKCHLKMTKKDAYICNKLQIQNPSLTFIHKNKSILSTTTFIFPSRMAYHTTVSLEKLTSTDSVDFGKCRDRFGELCWSKNDSNYLDLELNAFKKNNSRVFCLVQNFITEEAEFNHIMGLRTHLVNGAENVASQVKPSPVPIPTMSKYLDE